MINRYTLLLISALLLTLHINCQSEQDKIEDLSAIPEFPSDYQGQVYAGYLNVSAYQKSFFYFYYKSQQEDNDYPLVLWLNGGPGCSSMIGMVNQNGPFKFIDGSSKMQINNNAWNKKANMLYLESPAGVGFSQAFNDADLIANDTSVAEDNYNALISFFEKDQTESLIYKDFYIAGQSYAGIYIPRLAEVILQKNRQTQKYKINLKGILMGNACTTKDQCYNNTVSKYQVQFMYTRGFINTADYSKYQSECITGNSNSFQCLYAQTNITNKFYDSKSNIYNVYGYCFPKATSKIGQQYYEGVEMQDMPSYAHNVGHFLRCADTIGPNSLFNRNQNRKFLHIDEENDTLLWTPCSDKINYTMESKASYSTLLTLVKSGIKIVYFSGDFDAMVPIQGTIAWINKFRKDFGISIKKSWRPWTLKDKNENDVLAGMIWQLQGLTFYSVKAAGHMVPSDQPQAAYEIFSKFIAESTEFQQTDI